MALSVADRCLREMRCPGLLSNPLKAGPHRRLSEGRIGGTLCPWHRSPSLPLPDSTSFPSRKLDYLEALWARVVSKPEQIPVPDWHRKILAERLAAYRAGKGSSRP